MNALRSIASGKYLDVVVLMTITLASLSGRVMGAELIAPEVSAGEYTVSWTQGTGPEDTLYLREYRGAALIGRDPVTNTKSMKFCRPNGLYTYRLELCTDDPNRDEETCDILPGQAEVYVDRSFPDQWHKRVPIGANISEKGVDAVQADDDNFVLLCERRPNYNVEDLHLVKLGRCGEQFWERVLVSGNEVSSQELLRLDDGGYLIVGAVDGELFIVRTNRAGRTVAEVYLNNLGGDARGQSAIQISEDHFVIAGDTFVPPKGRQGILFEAKQVGGGFEVEQGRKTYFGGDHKELVKQVIATTDDGYAVAGYTASLGEGGEAYLVKFDSQLDFDWEKHYGWSGQEEAYGVLQSADGGFVLVGDTHSTPQGFADVYIVKTDVDGHQVDYNVETQLYHQTGKAIRQNPGGGYVVVADDLSSQGEVLFLLVDEELEVKESESIPVGYKSYAGSLELTDTIGWVMAGQARFEDTGGDWNAFLLYFKPGEWSGAYRGLFREGDGLSLYRTYRDRVLRSTPQGRQLVADIYANSQSVLITLLRHPQLMLQARKLLEVNRTAVRDVVDGRSSIIEHPETLLAFFDSFAERTEDDELKALAKRVNAMIRKHRNKGQPLFGFGLLRDARSAADTSARQ